MARSPQTARNATLADRALIAGFVVLLALPGFWMVGGPFQSESPSERRRLATFPPRSDLLPFPRAPARARLKAYVQDHFGFRTELIGLNSDLLYWVFGTSTSGRVLCGRDHWLYYSANDLEFSGGERGDAARALRYQSEIDQYRAIDLFTPSELEGIRLALVRQKEWADARGARFLLVIAPNKSTIYSEHLPPSIDRVGRMSRLDQLLDDLRKHTEIRALDLRGDLLRAKSKAPVYYRLDTHWNELGAYFAYERIARQLCAWFPQVKPVPFDRISLSLMPGRVGDLSVMLATIPPLSEYAVHLRPPESPRAVRVAAPFQVPGILDLSEHLFATQHPRKDLPKALILRDSFATAIQPLLSEHFSQAVYVWTNDLFRIDPGEFRPDVVIAELVERRLWTLSQLPLYHPEIAQPLAPEQAASGP